MGSTDARSLRRALLRGAVPSVVSLALWPFAPYVVPACVFTALVATALGLLDRALAEVGTNKRAVALAVAATVLHAVAIVQGAYAGAVIEQRSFEGGLRAVDFLLSSDFSTVGPFVLGAVGLAHAAVVLAEREPPAEPEWFQKLFFAAGALGLVSGLGSGHFEWCGLGAAGAIGVTFMSAGIFIAIYRPCDGLERLLWGEDATEAQP